MDKEKEQAREKDYAGHRGDGAAPVRRRRDARDVEGSDESIFVSFFFIIQSVVHLGSVWFG